MRGFASRSLVPDTLSWIDANTPLLQPTRVDLSEAAGHVLAEDVMAGVDVPGFDRSAMDGFALIASETEGAGDYTPLSFRVVGESLPGRGFAGTLMTGEAVRIMTGAPVPTGATAVVPAEFAREASSLVEIVTPVAGGKNIGRKGEDLRPGQIVLTKGRRLRPQDVAVLASLGMAEVAIIRTARVRILVTGNELVLPGQPLRGDQIYESNSYMLSALVRRDGGSIESVRYLPDVRESIAAAMTEPGADVVLVSGGSSVGAEDHAPSIVEGLGTLAIHGIAMRPSSPAGMGKIGEGLVFLLPGNPVSCLCAYDFFAGRAIRRLGGGVAAWPYRRLKVTVDRKIVSMVGRVDYCRVCFSDSSRNSIEPLALSGASILSSTTRADGFVIIPAESEGYGPGTEVEMFLYD